MFEAIEYALVKNIPIVITTHIYHGQVLPVYANQWIEKTQQKSYTIWGNNLKTAKDRLLLIPSIQQANGEHKKLNSFFE